MERSINESGVLAKMENDTLWNFIESIMPYLESNQEYIKSVHNDWYKMAIHRNIESFLRNRKHESEMRNYMNKNNKSVGE